MLLLLSKYFIILCDIYSKKIELDFDWIFILCQSIFLLIIIMKIEYIFLKVHKISLIVLKGKKIPICMSRVHLPEKDSDGYG